MSAIILPGTPAWFEARRTRITSTDVPALLGVTVDEGRYKDSTPWKIAARIKGMLPPAEDEDSDLFFYGTESEALNAKLYQRAVKRDAQQERSVIVSPGLCKHPAFDWLASTPDGTVIHDRPDCTGVWEAKAPIYGRRKWSEGVPLAYQVQVSVSMAILGLSWASVSALHPPSVDWADVERNETFIRNMLELLQEWRDRYILKDDMPPAEAGDSSILSDLHKQRPGKTIFLPLALSDDAHTLAEKVATHKALGEEIEGLKARLKQHMMAEQAETAKSQDGEVVFRFYKYEQTIKPKPAVEGGKRTATRFVRVTPKGDEE